MNQRLRVPPNRSVLLRLRKHRKTLLSAVELLEHKRRVLAQKTFELLPQRQDLHEQAYRQLGSAYRSYAMTRMRSTADELRQIIGGMPPMIELQTRREPLAGVATYQVSTRPVPLQPRFGLLGSTAELDRTIVSLRDATDLLAELAGMQATLRSLTRALQKTNRQVRVLRDRVIPMHDETIHEIEDILDEQERAYLFQLKRIR